MGHDGDLIQFVESFSHAAFISNLNRIPFASFNRGRHVDAAEASCDDLVDHHRRHPIASRLFAVDIEFIVRLAHHDVGVHRSGVNVMMLLQLLGNSK